MGAPGGMAGPGGMMGPGTMGGAGAYPPPPRSEVSFNLSEAP